LFLNGKVFDTDVSVTPVQYLNSLNLTTPAFLNAVPKSTPFTVVAKFALAKSLIVHPVPSPKYYAHTRSAFGSSNFKYLLVADTIKSGPYVLFKYVTASSYALVLLILPLNVNVLLESIAKSYNFYMILAPLDPNVSILLLSCVIVIFISYLLHSQYTGALSPRYPHRINVNCDISSSVNLNSILPNSLCCTHHP